MYNNFVVEGEKMVLELLQSSDFEVETLLALPDWLQAHRADISVSIESEAASARELEQISALKTPNQVLAVVKQRRAEINTEVVTQDLSLYLDGIQDPGNFGTILRTADWFGIKTVFSGPGTVDLYNPKVLQATMGAFLRVQVIEAPLDELHHRFPSIPICGTVLAGKNIFTTVLPSAAMIVIGSEGKGIRPDTEALLDQRLSIPMAKGGGAESLNAAIATGIVCACFRNLKS